MKLKTYKEDEVEEDSVDSEGELKLEDAWSKRVKKWKRWLFTLCKKWREK